MNQYSIFRKIFIIAVVVLGFVFALPNVVKSPFLALNQTVKLGLDLQGGAHLLLQVDKQSVLKEYYGGISDTVRGILRDEKIRYKNTNVAENSFAIAIKNISDVEKALKLTKDGLKDVEVEINGNNLVYRLTEIGIENKLVDVINQTIEVIRRRIDATGTQEPLIQRQGIERIVVQLPGVDNPDKIKSLLGRTAKLSFHLEQPNGVITSNSFKSEDEDGNLLILKKKEYLTGKNLLDAQPSYNNNQPVVSFRFDTEGARKFGRLTSKNVGRRIVILLDGEVISSPVVNEPILGGTGIISGNFTIEAVNELSILLRAGSLPAKLDVVEERTVGPGLGADSIASGKVASIMGLVFVILFMLFAYRRLGFYANVALAVNIVLILSVLTMLQATLTLPGIAGIVLTIGMAVDANVLIFERIREEFNKGAKLVIAMEQGFKSAFTTILDANITGLIAGVLLYVFGTGPVQGFAVTLSIGIVTSMFCAIMITRWMLISWIVRKNPAHLPKGF